MARTRELRIEDVVRLRQDGQTVRQIATAMACGVNLVRDILKSKGLDGNGRTITVERQQLLELWSTPRTLIEIGAELGCSSTTVLRLQKEHALPRRDCVRPPPDEDVTPEEDAASADSLALSPWVQARIKELRLGMPQEVAT